MAGGGGRVGQSDDGSGYLSVQIWVICIIGQRPTDLSVGAGGGGGGGGGGRGWWRLVFPLSSIFSVLFSFSLSLADRQV